MTTLVENIVKAFGIKGSVLGNRVLSVGAARLDGMTTESIIAETVAAVESATGTSDIVLDGFSTSSVNNAYTSFTIMTKNAAVPAQKRFLHVATKIEKARLKHGAKSVKDALKEFLAEDYTSDAHRADHVSEILDALIALAVPQKDEPQKTDAEKLVDYVTRAAGFLKTAVNLLDTAEIDDDQHAAIIAQLDNIGASASLILETIDPLD